MEQKGKSVFYFSRKSKGKGEIGPQIVYSSLQISYMSCLLFLFSAVPVVDYPVNPAPFIGYYPLVVGKETYYIYTHTTGPMKTGVLPTTATLQVNKIAPFLGGQLAYSLRGSNGLAVRKVAYS